MTFPARSPVQLGEELPFWCEEIAESPSPELVFNLVRVH
jgi:hypothetical protein